MKLRLDGGSEVALATPATQVVDVLAQPDELLSLLDGMLDPSSTADRWVVSGVRFGPVDISPEVDVEVARTADGVRIDGAPVPGRTPTRLVVHMQATPDSDDPDGGCRLRTSFELTLDLPGPQLLAGTVQPLAQGNIARTTAQIDERLSQRFGRRPA